MLELIIGIIIGATFADFWRYIYKIIRTGFNKWMKKNNNQNSSEFD